MHQNAYGSRALPGPIGELERSLDPIPMRRATLRPVERGGGRPVARNGDGKEGRVGECRCPLNNGSRLTPLTNRPTVPRTRLVNCIFMESLKPFQLFGVKFNAVHVTFDIFH